MATTADEHLMFLEMSRHQVPETSTLEESLQGALTVMVFSPCSARPLSVFGQQRCTVLRIFSVVSEGAVAQSLSLGASVALHLDHTSHAAGR